MRLAEHVGQVGWEDNSLKGLPEGLPWRRPVIDYTWEGHLETSLRDTVNLTLPAQWLQRALGVMRELSRLELTRTAQDASYSTIRDGAKAVLDLRSCSGRHT
jgi:hypothetical protein